MPLYLGGAQSATWQWFDMTQWQKTRRGDGNKGQGIHAAALAAPGGGAHQHRYLWAGAQAPLMGRSDHSCHSLGDQSSFAGQGPVQSYSSLFTCTFEFNVTQPLPFTSHFYSPSALFLSLCLFPGPLGLHSELSLGCWTYMLNCHSNHVLMLYSFKRPSRVWRRREGQCQSPQFLEAPALAQIWKWLGF